MSKEIQLSKGKIAVVDDKDFDELSKYNWYYHGKYARRGIWIDGKTKHVYMHRHIMNTPTGFDTDHINHDTLNNTRNNLRICSRSQNNGNMEKPSHNTSGYRGVSFDKRAGKWQARLNHSGKLVYSAQFKEKADAIIAYKNKYIDIYGEFAQIINKELA